MGERLAKSSPRKASAREIISQVLASKLLARNQKACGNKGASTTPQTERDGSEDLSNISDAEVVGYLNTKKEFLLKKILWEGMNRDYQKGRKRKDTTRSKKATPSHKTDPTKKPMTTAIRTSAETESKKRLSSKINYDALEKLFESEESSKRAKLDKPEADDDLKYGSQQGDEESFPESQYSDKGTDINESGKTCGYEFGNENHCEGAMHEDEEYYGAVDLEDQNEGEDYDYNNFDDEES